MNILEQIVAKKILEVEESKASHRFSPLEKSEFFRRKPLSLRGAILKEGSSGVIAEFKRMSPSRGIINGNAVAQDVCAGYARAGASAISVLTNREFFGGSMDDLAAARRSVSCPILCKDFIIDEYQITEARSYGADAVLLISDILAAEKLDNLYRFALSLGMQALIEVHDKYYFTRIPTDAGVVGINSRNLASLSVSLDHARDLVELLPENAVKVAESGIRSADDYFLMKEAGFDGFLIGEYFMKAPFPALACKEFIESIRKKSAS